MTLDDLKKLDAALDVLDRFAFESAYYSSYQTPDEQRALAMSPGFDSPEKTCRNALLEVRNAWAPKIGVTAKRVAHDFGPRWY